MKPYRPLLPKADRILNEIEEMVAKNCTAVDIAYTPADLCRLKKAGKKAVMLGIENGYAIGKDITNVERFRHRGVVYMTLCHNGNNDICGSARYNEEGLGVSTFGEQVIKEMNRVGMMVDVSHAGEKSFYDALAISGKPIVASHSSARALCDHPRNLTDDQLKALAAKGGGGTGMYVWRIPAQERRSYHQGCHRASEPHGKCHGHRTCRDRNRF